MNPWSPFQESKEAMQKKYKQRFKLYDISKMDSNQNGIGEFKKMFTSELQSDKVIRDALTMAKACRSFFEVESSMQKLDMSNYLKHIKVPVKLVYGSKNAQYQVEEGLDMQDKFPAGGCTLNSVTQKN